MADVVDMAAEIEAENIARALRRSIVPIADGVAGICDDCEEYMERLVKGRCGYCRDGRVPPSSRFDAPVSAPPAPVIQKEPEPMPESKSITFVATGAVLAEIKRRTADGTSNTRAALDLVESAIARPIAAPAPPPPAAPALPTIATIMADLNTVFGDLEARADRPDQAAELAAAIARAEDAERRADIVAERADAADAKLEKLREALET